MHLEYIPKGQTVNHFVYKEVLIHLRDAIRHKRPELWSSEDYYLHHDNDLAHTALMVRNYLAKNKVSVLPQPRYSPDLSPCDLLLFPKLKVVMKGQCYDDVAAIKQKTGDEVRRTSRESFKQCMQAWVKQRDHRISSSGCYFERDKFDWVDIFSIFCINKSALEPLDQPSYVHRFIERNYCVVLSSCTKRA